MTRNELNQLMEEYYGSTGEDFGMENADFEGGVVDDNYALADWARHVVPDLFEAISDLLNGKE